MKQLPAQLLRDLQGVPGFDEARFIAAHTMPAVVSVRLHPQKPSGAFAQNETVPWCTSGRYLPERPVFTLDPLYHAGAYYVQEASSMFLDHMLRYLLPDKNGLRVLDLCAAPGGKSTLIASLIGKDSLLVANEVIRSRASVLEENIARWGYMNTWVCSNDPKDIGKLTGYFDVIVVDAPCSGSGLFRKDEAALSEWSEANVQLCHQRQQRILADIWPALKQDGLLVYATCSYSPQEDEHILDWLHDEFDAEQVIVPGKQEWGVAETITPGGMKGYRFFPDRLKGEGFFIAAARKTGHEKKVAAARFKSAADKKIQQQAESFLAGEEWVCVKTGEEYSALLPVHEEDRQLLEKYIYLRRVGLPIGTPSHKEWLPAHDIALSIDRSRQIKAIDISREQALKFLKKEDAGIQAEEKGWYIVTYENHGLGWIKALGHRVNNYLPKHWRIRMDINGTE